MVSITHFFPIVYPIYELMMSKSLNPAHEPPLPGAYWQRGVKGMRRSRKLILAAALALAVVMSVLAVAGNLGLLGTFGA